MEDNSINKMEDNTDYIEDDERLTVSFSLDGKTWGLKNECEHEWDFNNPMTHEMESPELKSTKTIIDTEDPEVDLFSETPKAKFTSNTPRKWFLLDMDIPRAASKITKNTQCADTPQQDPYRVNNHSGEYLHFKFTYYVNGKSISEIITCPPDNSGYINIPIDAPISAITWYQSNLQYAETSRFKIAEGTQTEKPE